MNSSKRPSRILGPLELTVIDVLWTHGQKTVREVGDLLQRPLAYTTVMTTLDRLYKKGLLDREKVDRAFRYSARISTGEAERQRASAFLAPFLRGPGRELLVSCLLDEAANKHDEAVLDELERRIREKREELRGTAK